MRYAVPRDLPPEVRDKIKILAKLIGEKQPTTAQVSALLRQVAKDTGYPLTAVRTVYALALKRDEATETALDPTRPDG